jgi:hypothetical protein
LENREQSSADAASEMSPAILNSEDPFLMVRHLPAWAKEAALVNVPLSVRCRNVFTAQGFTSLADLIPYTTDEARHWKNFGRQSVIDLVESLRAFLALGPGQLAPSHEIPNSMELPPLLACLERVFLSLPLREADVLKLRWGFDGKRRTLEEVGGHFGVTRERIRQIEAKSVRKLSMEQTWLAALGARVSMLLLQRTDPLYLDLLEVEDHWFTGCSMRVPLFDNLLENFGDGTCHLIEVNYRGILCKLTQEGWDTAQKDVLRRFSERVQDRLTEPEMSIIAEAALPDAPELKELMIGTIGEHLRFGSNDRGERVLIAAGRRVTSAVNAILDESPEPLHFAAVWEKAVALLNRPVQLNYIHATLQSVNALYFDRGVYGSWRHMPLTLSEQADLLSVLEDWIAENEQFAKQWHTQEFLEMLLREPRFASMNLTKYLVDIVLRKAERAVPIGRMVWVSKRLAQGGGTERIDVSEACMRILIDYGAPMETQRIRKILQENRGLGLHFQIHPSRYLARVSRGCWGLVERDFDVSREGYATLVETAFSYISSIGELVEIDNLIAHLRHEGAISSILSAFAAVNLLQTDERLHIFRGAMAGLSEWAASEEISNDAFSESGEVDANGSLNLVLDFEDI